jgi:tRNA_anti-like
MKKFFKVIGPIFLGLMCLGLIAAFIAPKPTPEQAQANKQASDLAAAQKSADAQQKTAATLAAIPAFTSTELARAYEANSVAADAQFKGKDFKISGAVSDINTDFMGRPYITMSGGNQFMQPQFQFSKSDMQQMAALKKGMKITILCTGRGDVAKIPMSDDCKILQ